jgi:hypothetical protein
MKNEMSAPCAVRLIASPPRMVSNTLKLAYCT